MIGKAEKEKLAGEYLDIGKKLYELEDFRDSIRNLQKAIRIYESLPEYKNQVEALVTLGVVYSIDGSEELSVDSYLRALSIANAHNYSFQIARIYNNIGSGFQELHETEKSIDYFEKSEEALKQNGAKKDPRYDLFSVVLHLNLAKAYCEKQDAEKAVKYLAMARKIVGDDTDNNFYIPVLLVECRVALVKGNEEYVRKHIDEVIEGVVRNKSRTEFVQNVSDLCRILEDINDEAHYKWVVMAFETYTKMHNSPYFNMLNAHFWADYYRYIGDIPHYQEMCVKHLNAYDKYVKVNQKNKAVAFDMRIELQGKDYHRFFEKYLANMEEEEAIENAFRNATDKDEWLLNLQQRTQYLSELYVDNENLIERYITPVLQDEVEMDDELASELFKGIWNIYQLGKTEFRIGVELALKLEPYFEEKGHIEEHIRTLIIITSAYTKLNHKYYFDEYKVYLDKLENYRAYFNETKDKETKRLLCLAYFANDICRAENKTTTLSQTLDSIEKNLKYLDEYKVAKVIGLSEEQLIYYKEKFIQDVISSNLIFYDEVDSENEEYRRCYELVSDIYARIFDRTGDEYRINERIYGSYTRLLYLTGKITKEECYELHKNYFCYYIVDGKSAGDELLPIQDQRRFRLMMFYVPELLMLADYEVEKEFCDDLLYEYLQYIKSVSNDEFDNTVGRIICSSLSKVMVYMDDIVDAVDMMMSVIVERDVNLSIHSHMVAEIARLILEMIYRNDCKLLVGNLGIEDEQDATEFWPEVMDFVENSAMIHDVGKIDVSSITKKQTRKLSDLEFDNVKHHPQFGAMIVNDAEYIKPYLPVILGHHKDYDDQKGYPAEYKYTDNLNPLIVNIIQMADSLDAATDSISRAYAIAKTSEDVLREFEEGKGTRYNPALVDMMLQDEKFQEELAELTTDGRKDICFNIFSSYLVQE